MENQEANNIQQEIIDSLARKMTGLEKRQSKIEELDLTGLPSKLEELETMVKETADMKTLETTKQLQQFGSQLNRFDTKLDAIPKAIPVKHEFDPKSKFVIKIISGLALATAAMLAITVSLWLENSHRGDETNKFLIVRGFYPDVAKHIDSAYVTNKDTLVRAAQAKIDEQQSMSQAAFEAKQAAEESKLADKKLKEIKDKTQTAGKQKRKK